MSDACDAPRRSRDPYWEALNLLAMGWLTHEYELFESEMVALRDRLRAILGGRTPEEWAWLEREAEIPVRQKDQPTPDIVDLWRAGRFDLQTGTLGDSGPATGCVYALLAEDGELLYVGKAQNGESRFRSHVNDYVKRSAGWCRWRAWLIDREEDRVAIERHLIEELDPILNIAGRRKPS